MILSAVAEGAACRAFSPDLSEVIQITVVVRDSVFVADTLRAHATAATARGDTVPATLVWTSSDTTVLAPVDSSTGVFVGQRAGTANIQARTTGDLRSNPIPILVIAAPPP